MTDINQAINAAWRIKNNTTNISTDELKQLRQLLVEFKQQRDATNTHVTEGIITALHIANHELKNRDVH